MFFLLFVDHQNYGDLEKHSRYVSINSERNTNNNIFDSLEISDKIKVAQQETTDTVQRRMLTEPYCSFNSQNLGIIY
jgi:hypothetical protein